MKYFKDIITTYTVDGKEIMRLARDVRFNALNNEKYLIDYYIKDGDTPESIASDLYGDSDLWWIVMLSANIINRFEDWPLTDICVTAYYNYLVSQGESVTLSVLKQTNDAKRSIQILDEKYVTDLLYAVEQTLLGV